MRIAIDRVVALPRLALLAELRVGEDDAPVDALEPVVAATLVVVVVVARHRARDGRVRLTTKTPPLHKVRRVLGAVRPAHDHDVDARLVRERWEDVVAQTPHGRVARGVGVERQDHAPRRREARRRLELPRRHAHAQHAHGVRAPGVV